MKRCRIEIEGEEDEKGRKGNWRERGRGKMKKCRIEIEGEEGKLNGRCVAKGRRWKGREGRKRRRWRVLTEGKLEVANRNWLSNSVEFTEQRYWIPPFDSSSFLYLLCVSWLNCPAGFWGSSDYTFFFCLLKLVLIRKIIVGQKEVYIFFYCSDFIFPKPVKYSNTFSNSSDCFLINFF